MQFRRFVLGLALAGATLVPTAEALAGDPGSAGLLSLRLALGARNGAMGDTGVASSFDGSSVFWNPANMTYAEGTQLTLQHMEYLGLFRKESVGITHQTEYGSLGLLFSGFYSEELDRTDDEPAGVALGTFQPYDLVIGLAYAFQTSQVSVGITGKIVYERIDTYDGVGSAVDIGITHKAQIEGLTLAAVLQNYGDQFSIDQQQFDLPTNFRMGASYAPPQWTVGEDGTQRATLAAELLVPNDGNGRLHAGGEVYLHESFALRGGHRFAYETWSFTAGAGFRSGTLRVDYAYMANQNDFEDSHRISLGVAYD